MPRPTPTQPNPTQPKPTHPPLQPYYAIFGTLFSVLYFLHLYWTWLILQVGAGARGGRGRGARGLPDSQAAWESWRCGRGVGDPHTCRWPRPTHALPSPILG
jgi:hypothetical protein